MNSNLPLTQCLTAFTTIKTKILSTFNWVPFYLIRSLRQACNIAFKEKAAENVFFCICDHFEPYWNKADSRTAHKRIQTWLDQYPRIAERVRDSGGQVLKYSFFYPEEEYRKEDLDELAGLCHAGYGEVEIHLHHDNDNGENLRRTLIDYKKRLHHQHGLLSVDRTTGIIAYGFIHGNWALDNSRPDGRWCGVNNEIDVLQETGCFADFTMPSAPSATQTRKVNSIYYTTDDPELPKSHERGIDAEIGKNTSGLLMIQGPLCLNWKNRKFAVLPKIENGGLMSSNPINKNRIQLWVGQRIHIKKADNCVFVKIYTHGTQEANSDMLLKHGGLQALLELMKEVVSESGGRLHFVSAREMVNVIKALTDRYDMDIDKMRDYRFQTCKNRSMHR